MEMRWPVIVGIHANADRAKAVDGRHSHTRQIVQLLHFFNKKIQPSQNRPLSKEHTINHQLSK